MLLKNVATAVCSMALVYSWPAHARTENEVDNITNAIVSSDHKVQFRAIVNGHNLQPRDDQLKSLHINDVSPQDSQTIDLIYQRLLAHNSRFMSGQLTSDKVRRNAAGALLLEEGLSDRLQIC